MSIKDRIYNDVKDAMRAQDKNKLSTLRLITAAIKQVEVDERIEVTEDRVLIILDKMTKQRKESIAQFEKAGRDDLVKQEQFELGIIAVYLPEPLSKAEIESLVSKAIEETGAQRIPDMGKVMAILKPQVQGRYDIGQLSALVKSRLT